MLRVMQFDDAGTWRGGQQQVLYLIQALRDRVENYLISPGNSPLARKVDELGVKVIPFKFMSEISPFAVYRFIRIVESVQPDIVHCHTAHSHTLALLAKKFHPKFKLVVSRRVDFQIKGKPFNQWKYKSELIDHYHVISRKVMEMLVEIGLNEDKMSLAYSGIDWEKFQKDYETDYLNDEFPKRERVCFGSVAALVGHKDHHTLIRAASILKEKYDKFFILLIGSGRLEEELRQEVKNLKLEDHIIFAGFRKDIPLLLKYMDVFVMSSKTEGLGTSLIDALASGKPLVGTDAGGIPEILSSEKMGCLVPPRNPEKLAEGLLAIIKRKEEWGRIAEFNRNSAKKFDYHNTADGILEMYGKITRKETE